jgi:hypothetical protein
MDAKRVAARYRLGVLSNEEIKDYALTSLERGRWSPAIDDIVSATHPIRSEVGPALETLLAEQGVEIPDTEEAVWVVLRGHLGDIASGAIPPKVGMERVMSEVCDPAGLHARTRRFLGDSHGLEHLIGAFYAYDDLLERPSEVSMGGRFGEAAFDAWGRQVIDLARDWLLRHGSDR